MFLFVCSLILRPNQTIMVMLSWSVSQLFLGRLRPPRWWAITDSRYFCEDSICSQILSGRELFPSTLAVVWQWNHRSLFLVLEFLSLSKMVGRNLKGEMLLS